MPVRRLVQLVTVLACMGAATQCLAQNEPDFDLSDRVNRQRMIGLAEGGNTYAMWELAYAYENGKGVARDLDQAICWWTRAAEAGLPEAMLALGRMNGAGIGMAVDHPKAVAWYTKALEKKSLPRAMLELAFLYQDGVGVTHDNAKAFELLTRAAERKYVPAMEPLGRAYKDGRGTLPDAFKAAEWFTRSAEAGDPNGMCSIGYLYHIGSGVPQDDAKRNEWYARAVERDSVWAMQALGSAYLRGIGKEKEKDFPKGIAVLERGASKDDLPCMTLLAWYRVYGPPSVKNIAEGEKWYVKAASLGDSTSMVLLVELYGTGRDHPLDTQSALTWLKKAKEAKDLSPEALGRIGGIYEYGCGVERNDCEAFKWYLRAAEAGDVDSMVRVSKFYRAGLGIAQSDTKADEWQKKAGKADRAKSAFREPPVTNPK